MKKDPEKTLRNAIAKAVDGDAWVLAHDLLDQLKFLCDAKDRYRAALEKVE